MGTREGLTFDVDICALLQKKVDDGVAFLDAGGDHEGGPAHGVLVRDQKGFLGMTSGSSHLDIRVEVALLG